MDWFQFLFLGGSALLMLVQSVRGWRLGVARQLVNLGALIPAYGVAVGAGKLAAPILRPLGYPDVLTSVIAGSIVGGALYYAVTIAGAHFFRRTDQQKLRLTRIGYGAGGSALGLTGAIVTVWLSVLAIRCLGTVAEAEVRLAQTPEGRRAGIVVTPLALELAGFKHSLDTGPTAAVIDQAVPDRMYDILGKIAEVISSVDSMQRFVTYPGTRALSQNPRIQALQNDPEIERQVGRRDFVGLLANPKIVAAINDPALAHLVSSFQLEKALDYALAGSASRPRTDAKD
jgi:hypothetical protein